MSECSEYSNSSQYAVFGTKKKPRYAKSALCELLLDLMEKPRNIEVLGVLWEDFGPYPNRVISRIVLCEDVL